jgi:RNA polymerase sigma-70 factor (ECF subfamily)
MSPAGDRATTTSSTALAEAPEEEHPIAATPAERARAGAFARDQVDFAWRLARRLGLGPADAEDVAQRAMLVIAQRIGDVAEGSERAFVFRTVQNLVSKVFRTRRRRPEEPEEAADEPVDHDRNPETLLEQRRARDALDRILEALSPTLRSAFVLFEIEGLSQPEIAVALDVPLGTVASRLRRAREEFTRIGVEHGVLPEATVRER